ncbi:MAG: cytochrome c-type biogenesis protein CcmH [Deltaproteobacteria bacterium]|nr:cytochrome c-type biogenesis protein CcmH [Deltaproteobacteria bacterium]
MQKNHLSKGLILFLGCLFIASVFLPKGLMADELEDQVRKIAHQLRCPTCQALSVKESEAGLAVNMKNTIRQMLIQGKSEDEILKFFEDRYGEWILRSPRKSGFNLLLWFLPGALILGACLVLLFYMKNRFKKSSREKPIPLSDQEKELVERKIREITRD